MVPEVLNQRFVAVEVAVANTAQQPALVVLFMLGLNLFDHVFIAEIRTHCNWLNLFSEKLFELCGSSIGFLLI